MAFLLTSQAHPKHCPAMAKAMPPKLVVAARAALLGLCSLLSLCSLWRSGEDELDARSRARRLGASPFHWARQGWEALAATKLLPGPCVVQEVQGTVQELIWSSEDLVRSHWILLVLGVLGALVGAAAFILKEYLARNATAVYTSLLQMEGEGDEGTLMAKGEVVLMVGFWVADMLSDVYVTYSYFKSGLYVFGSLLITIWLGSGCIAFLHRRLSWQRCDSGIKADLYFSNLNEQGEPLPTWTTLMLYLLQVEPIIMAYKSWGKALSKNLQEEKILSSLCEGAPSSLLQIYALMVSQPSGNPYLLAGSIALSIFTVAKGLNKAYELCMPEGRKVEKALLPQPALLLFRMCDGFARLGLWALLGFSLRPSGAAKQGIQQPFLPLIMLAELLIVVLLFKSKSFGLDLKWSALWAKNYFVGIIACFLSTFWCFFNRQLTAQRRFFRSLLAFRTCEAVGIIVLAIRSFSSPPGDECALSENPSITIIGLMASMCYLFSLLLAICDDAALSCCCVPIFPMVSGWQGGRLETAARLGFAAHVDHLFEQSEPAERAAALCQAAEAGHVSVVHTLLRKSTSASAIWEGTSAMHCAAKAGQLEVMKLLKDKGGDLKATDGNGATPAFIAAENGQAQALSFLQTSDCDLEKANKFGQTPAWIAASNGHLEVLKLLKGCNCNLKARDSGGRGRTPADAAAEHGHVDVLQLLHAAGCDLAAASKYAAQEGHVEVLRFLQSLAVDLDMVDAKGVAPCHAAAATGQLEALRFLHAAGCNMETVDEDGVTPAHFAARVGHVETLRFLHSVGCNLETVNKHGDTSVHVAAKEGHVESLKFLHSVGCTFKVTVLHAAIERNQLAAVQFLIGIVDVNMPGLGGAYALDIAKANHSSSALTAVLEKAGAIGGPQPQLVGLTALKPRQPPSTGLTWFTCGLPELAQSGGKFYYEIQFLSDFKCPQVGWASAQFQPGEAGDIGVGDDAHSWAFDGQRCLWWNDREKKALEISRWSREDIIGLAVDLDNHEMQLRTKHGTEATMPFHPDGPVQLGI